MTRRGLDLVDAHVSALREAVSPNAAMLTLHHISTIRASKTRPTGECSAKPRTTSGRPLWTTCGRASPAANAETGVPTVREAVGL